MDSPNTRGAVDATTEAVIDAWKSALDVDEVATDATFAQLGGDSLKVLIAYSKLMRQGLGVDTDPQRIHQTVEEWADSFHSAPQARTSQQPRTLAGEIPLLAAQQAYFDSTPIDPHWGNMGHLRWFATFDKARFEAALMRVFDHHDALRAKFELHDDGWVQAIVPTDALRITIEEIDLSGLAYAEQQARFQSVVVDREGSVVLSEAPLMRCILFFLGETQGYVLRLLLHHLLTDGTSFEVFKEDLYDCYEASLSETQWEFQAKTASILEWHSAMSVFTNSPHLAPTLESLRTLPRDRILDLQTDFAFDGNNNASKHSETFRAQLPQELTETLLSRLASAPKLPMVNMVTFAVARAVTAGAGSGLLPVTIMDSGRDLGRQLDVDISRTIGFLSTERFFALEAPGNEENLLDSAVDQSLRMENDAHKGQGLFWLRHYHADCEVRAELRALPAAEIAINYFGIVSSGSTGTSARETLDWDPEDLKRKLTYRAPESGREFKLFCIIGIVDRKLTITWEYSRQLHKEATIHAYHERFARTLQRIGDEFLSRD